MPSSSSSVPTSPRSPDENKKVPPPVASKPSRGKSTRSSILSIISNQSTTNSCQSESQSPSPNEQSLKPPTQNIQQSAVVPIYNRPLTDENEFNDTSLPPPPPAELLAAQLSVGDTRDSEFDTSDMDFPPPPEDIQSPVEPEVKPESPTEPELKPQDHAEPDVSASELASSSLGTRWRVVEVSQSEDQTDRAAVDIKRSDEIHTADVITKPSEKQAWSYTTDINTEIRQPQAHTNGLDIHLESDKMDTSESISSPLSEGDNSISNTLDTAASEDSVSIEGDLTVDSEHIATKLPIHSSFSTLDTDAMANTNHATSTSRAGVSETGNEGLQSPASVNSYSGEEELNHNTKNQIISDSNYSASNRMVTATSSHTTAATSNSTTTMTSFNTSSQSADSGIYSLAGETIQVKLRPTRNDNKKSDYSVPIFERNSTEMRRVTFQESDRSSQPILPAVNTQRTPRELERIKKTGLSEDDVSQTELFYKGHKTEVMVCQCLATLYFAEGSSGDSVHLEDWKPEHIGIPVLIYDTGDGKRARGLTMVFAEKGTGFSLWKTVINYESRWEVVEPIFHRLKVSGSNDQLAGIAFQDVERAESFYKYFKDCTADPELNVLNNPNLKLKKKDKKSKQAKKQQFRLPKKIDISLPCQFAHVTQLKQSEDGILAHNMVDDESASSEDGTIISK